MKVKHLQGILSGIDPEEEVCFLLYRKSLFWSLGDDDELTPEGWSKVVWDFEHSDFDDIFEYICDRVDEHVTQKEETQ